MASRSRRTQIILSLVALTLVYILFFSSESTPSSTFRSRTESALHLKHSPLRGDLSDEELTAVTAEKLQEIISKKGDVDDYWKLAPTDAVGRVVLQGTRAKETAVPKAAIEMEDVSIGGRKTMPKPKLGEDKEVVKADQKKQEALREKEKPKYPKSGDTEEAFNGNKIETVSDPGEEMARHELQSILKKSPIIIFSKSHCPYSKRAKHILLEEYDIVPKPFVVELDLLTEKVPGKKKGYDGSSHEEEGGEAPSTLGKKVQDLLKTLTGRKTVPNIMINSQSLGGSDEVVKLDTENGLGEKIKKMGGKRIVSVERIEGKKYGD